MSLLERLAALKAAQGEETPKAEAPEKVEPKQEEVVVAPAKELTIAERLAAIQASKTKQATEREESKPTTAALVKNLQAKAEAKVPVTAPATSMNVTETKQIIANISALEASPEMKELEGFNWNQFETAMMQINSLQDAAFPEISTALGTINRDMRKFPELAHLLNHEQIAAIVQRVLIQKNLWIAPQKAAKAAKKPAAVKAVELLEAAEEVSLDDL